MRDKLQHEFTATRKYLGGGYGDLAVITVAAGLHQIGKQRPYFSVTAEVRSRPGGGVKSCGCQHNDVLAVWPELAPIIALHLSDDRGVPMHAESNGWYKLAGFYGGAGEQYHAGTSKMQHWKPTEGPAGTMPTFDGYREPTQDECLAMFARHVRISVDEARSFATIWRDFGRPDVLPEPLNFPDWTQVRAAYTAWVTAQEPRWQAEADASVALLDRLAAAPPVPFDPGPTPKFASITSTVQAGALAKLLSSWQRDANGYRVTLKYQRRTLAVDYWQGPAITEEPTTLGVLDCLISDAQMGEQSFEEFCREFGHEPDSRSAHATWRACARMVPKLKRLLGDDYDAILQERA